MAACTRRPVAARAPDRTPLTGANAAGSGPSPSTDTACRSAGRLTGPTATTSACSNRLSTTSPPSGCSSTSTPCTSTVVTTPAPCASVSPATGSPTSTSSAAVPRCPVPTSSRCDSGCAGSSKPPTPGGRTTANSAATPTVATTTATPPSASPPSCSSSASSPPGATAGAQPDGTYPLKSLCGTSWRQIARSTNDAVVRFEEPDAHSADGAHHLGVL